MLAPSKTQPVSANGNRTIPLKKRKREGPNQILRNVAHKHNKPALTESSDKAVDKRLPTTQNKPFVKKPIIPAHSHSSSVNLSTRTPVPSHNSHFKSNLVKDSHPIRSANTRKVPPQRQFNILQKKTRNFDKDKENLLNNLSHLFNILTDKEANEKEKRGNYHSKRDKVNTKRGQTDDKLRNLRSKVKLLDKRKQELEANLEQQRSLITEKAEDVQAKDCALKGLSSKVWEKEVNLKQLLRQKQELKEFINNLEGAIDVTKQRTHEHFDDMCSEQKKIMIIQELIHMKKKTVRTVVFLDESQSRTQLQDEASDLVFEAKLAPDGRRLLLTFNEDDKNLQQKKMCSSLFDVDTVCHVEGYSNEKCKYMNDHTLSQIESLYTTIFQTNKVRKNFVFIYFAHDANALRLCKMTFDVLVALQATQLADKRQVFEVSFDGEGQIASEKIIAQEKFSCIAPDTKRNVMITFGTKGKTVTDDCVFSFFMITQNMPYISGHLQNIKKFSKVEDVMIPIEYTPGQRNIDYHMKETFGVANSYALGCIPSLITTSQDGDGSQTLADVNVLLNTIQLLR